MPRQLRLEYPGAVYHVVNRGDRREEIFRVALTANVSSPPSPKPAEEAKAQRLVAGEMDRIGWTEQELRGAPKGDKRKVRMAARLRRETTMSLKWIAERLAMGSWTNVSNLLGG